LWGSSLALVKLHAARQYRVSRRRGQLTSDFNSRCCRFHAFPAAVPGGFVGVDVFFVISGYLISTLIFTELKGGTFSFANFNIRRARRIFPALLLVLIFVWGAGWHRLIATDFARLGEDIAAGASYLSNIFFLERNRIFRPDSRAEAAPPSLVVGGRRAILSSVSLRSIYRMEEARQFTGRHFCDRRFIVRDQRCARLLRSSPRRFLSAPRPLLGVDDW
jgi:hypothetical protein